MTVLAALVVALRRPFPIPPPPRWLVPAALSLLLLGWLIAAMNVGIGVSIGSTTTMHPPADGGAG